MDIKRMRHAAAASMLLGFGCVLLSQSAVAGGQKKKPTPARSAPETCSPYEENVAAQNGHSCAGYKCIVRCGAAAGFPGSCDSYDERIEACIEAYSRCEGRCPN